MISKGNHVNFARFVLLAVGEEAKTFSFLFRTMLNKRIIRFGFCNIQNNQGRGKGYPYLDLDYSEYLKNPIQ